MGPLNTIKKRSKEDFSLFFQSRKLMNGEFSLLNIISFPKRRSASFMAPRSWKKNCILPQALANRVVKHCSCISPQIGTTQYYRNTVQFTIILICWAMEPLRFLKMYSDYKTVFWIGGSKAVESEQCGVLLGRNKRLNSIHFLSFFPSGSIVMHQTEPPSWLA